MHKATLKGNAKCERVVKIIDKKAAGNDTSFQKEIEILKKLDHPHIVRMHEIYEFNSFLYLVFE